MLFRSVAEALGWVHFRMGKLDQALVELLEARRLGPTTAELLEHLGDVFRALGRRAEAADAYKEALSLHPDEGVNRRALEKLRSLAAEG